MWLRLSSAKSAPDKPTRKSSRLGEHGITLMASLDVARVSAVYACLRMGCVSFEDSNVMDLGCEIG
jgi:hypothetical protein